MSSTPACHLFSPYPTDRIGGVEVQLSERKCVKKAIDLHGAWWLQREGSILQHLHRNRRTAVVAVLERPINKFGLRDLILEPLKPLPASCMHLVGGVLKALCDMHIMGVVHGDIKPEHFMVDAMGCVKVIDFNLALHYCVAQQGEGCGAGGSLHCVLHAVILSHGTQAREATKRPRLRLASLFLLLLTSGVPGRASYTGAQGLLFSGNPRKPSLAPTVIGTTPGGHSTQFCQSCSTSTPRRAKLPAHYFKFGKHVAKVTATNGVFASFGSSPGPGSGPGTPASGLECFLDCTLLHIV